MFAIQSRLMRQNEFVDHLVATQFFFEFQSFSLAWGCEQHEGLSTFQTTRRLVTETFSSPPTSFSTLFLINVHNWVWIFSRKQDKRLAFNFPGQALCFNSDFQYLSNVYICALLLHSFVKKKLWRKDCKRYPVIFDIFLMVLSNPQLSTSRGHRHDSYKLFYLVVFIFIILCMVFRDYGHYSSQLMVETSRIETSRLIVETRVSEASPLLLSDDGTE